MMSLYYVKGLLLQVSLNFERCFWWWMGVDRWRETDSISKVWPWNKKGGGRCSWRKDVEKVNEGDANKRWADSEGRVGGGWAPVTHGVTRIREKCIRLYYPSSRLLTVHPIFSTDRDKKSLFTSPLSIISYSRVYHFVLRAPLSS